MSHVDGDVARLLAHAEYRFRDEVWEYRLRDEPDWMTSIPLDGFSEEEGVAVIAECPWASLWREQ